VWVIQDFRSRAHHKENQLLRACISLGEMLAHFQAVTQIVIRSTSSSETSSVRRSAGRSPCLQSRACRAAKNAAASDAFDAAVNIAFLSAFKTASQEARYCA